MDSRLNIKSSLPLRSDILGDVGGDLGCGNPGCRTTVFLFFFSFFFYGHGGHRHRAQLVLLAAQ